MVVGIKSVTEELMELQLVPLIQKTKKKNIQDIAMNFDTEAKQLIDAFLQEKQYRTTVYMTRQWCSDNNIIPFRHVVLELELGELAEERIGR